MKKVISILLCIALCAALAACGGGAGKETQPAAKYSFAAVPLTDEEKEIISMMGEDVIVVTDADYVATVVEVLYHGAAHSGKVYQMEGTLTVDGENVTLSRNLVSSKETQTLSLPLRYLEKDIGSGAWVRVTGIVSVDAESGASVLDIVAIECLDQQGQANMNWDGGEIHQH